MLVEVLAAIPTGPYINGYAVLALIIVLLPWARLLTWIDKDAPTCRLPRTVLNSAFFGGMLGAVFLFLVAPFGLWGGFGVLIGILLAELGVYLGLRYQKVGLNDIKEQLRGLFERKGEKKEKKSKSVAGQVTIINKAGVPMPEPDGQTPERVQYDTAMQLLTEPMRREAEKIELMSTSDGAAASYQVDGVLHEGPSVDRAAASAVTAYFKFVAGLDTNEKRKPQTGAFKTVINGVKREMKITVRGSSSGESMTIISDPKKRHGFTLANLGFSAEQLQTVKDMITDGSGLVLLAVPPGHGLTALEYAIMRGHDAFLQHLITIEREVAQEIEGVTQNVLPLGCSGQEEAKQVAWVVSQEPDVVLMATVEDSNAARDLAGYAESAGRRAYVGLRALSAFDALRQWRKLVGDDNLAIKSLRMIIAGRAVRMLCENCKIGYTPDPTLLKKLNMDPTRVSKLFQARTSPMRDAKGNPVPCTACNDLAFKGRVGVFEILLIDDEMRQLLVNNASDPQIKQAFRQQKGRYLQEMALELVERGVTSVNEVQRAMKPAEPAAGSGGAAAAPRSSKPVRPKR
jgi:type II secretory ATPase GspE/PulE/Tfp pilus assembly ATPase PilB-like protein